MSSSAREAGSRKKTLSSASVSLTRREEEILSLFAQGLDGKRVAEKLSIAYATARNHGQRILKKLGVHSRLAAVARSYQIGLVLPPGAGVFRRRGSKTHRRGSSRKRV